MLPSVLRVLFTVFAIGAGPAFAAEAHWIESGGVRIFEPPREHPRLYLQSADLPDVRRRMAHPVLKPVWQQLQDAAKMNTQIRVEVDALRYLVDRDGQLGRRTIADGLRQMERFREEKEQNNSRKIGRMMVTGAIVYDWCYALLTAEQKEAFAKNFVRLAGMLECHYPPRRAGLVIGHPSEWMILRDMLSAGIAIYDEAPEMYRLAAALFFGEHVPARSWWYPGHAFSQGPGYADARFLSDMYPLFMFDRMGAGNVFNPSQQFVPYEWIYLRRPDGKFIRSGDGQNWPTRLGTLLTASYYHDGYLLSNYLVDPEVPPDDPLFHFLWNDPESKYPRTSDNKIFEFLWRDPDLKPRPVSDLPLSRYFGFPYGWMVARTGWDASSAIVQMRVNIENLAGHQHADGGSFEIYYKEPLAIHSGVYQGVTGGYGSAHHSNYYQRTIAHNSLLIYDPDEKFMPGGRKELVNDGGQRLVANWVTPHTLSDILKSDDYRTGTVEGQSFGPEPQRPAYTYLKGDITAAYSKKVRQVKGSFVFLNLNGNKVPAALVVFDRVVSANPGFRKYWLLQSVAEPKVSGNQAVLSGRLVNTTLVPEPDNTTAEVIGGKGREFWVFGKNFPNATVPPDPEAGGWRVQISPKQARAEDLFLNVLEMTDDARPLPVRKVDAGSLLGIQLADRVVLLSRNGERQQTPLQFQVEGQGIQRILVADLAEGTWQIWRDGQIVKPATGVSAEAGTLYFEGPAGSYQLRR
jgi:heparin/heparan-sulfate lyase